MDEWQVQEELKRDSLGRVELVRGPAGLALRRVACGGALPASALVARWLLRRERKALAALSGAPGTPQLAPASEPSAAPSSEVLLREWVAGQPLHLAESLPCDFFEHLDDLVEDLHRRGVCHNDLHKEQNILVGADGFPHLIDFQLASVHRRRGPVFRSRSRDDLRHAQKHRRRYTRAGRAPAAVTGDRAQGRGHGLRRGTVAAIWRRTGKPLYNFITRRLLGTSDGELRRDSSGPWPRWMPASGTRGADQRSG